MSMRMETMTKWYGDEIIRNMRTAMKGSVEELALTTEEYAKKLCPVDQGTLRASIHYTMKDSISGTAGEKDTPIMPRPEEEETAYVGSLMNYAAYQEYGTKNMDAQPYMRPAIDYTRGKSIEIIKMKSKLVFVDYINRVEAI